MRRGRSMRGAVMLVSAAYILGLSLACGKSGDRQTPDPTSTRTTPASPPPIAPPTPLVVTEGPWTVTFPPGWLQRGPREGGDVAYTDQSGGPPMMKLHALALEPSDDIELLAAMNHRGHRDRGHRMLPMQRHSYAGAQWYDVEYTADTPNGGLHFIWRVTGSGTAGISMECTYPEAEAAAMRPTCDSIMMSARPSAPEAP